MQVRTPVFKQTTTIVYLYFKGIELLRKKESSINTKPSFQLTGSTAVETSQHGGSILIQFKLIQGLVLTFKCGDPLPQWQMMDATAWLLITLWKTSRHP